LGEGTRHAYLAVRELAGPMLVDRTLDEDIRAVRAAVEGGASRLPTRLQFSRSLP
jgi:histidine ammonia-lyase